MTIKEALEFIHSVSWMGSTLGLHRINELIQRLGSPVMKGVIHIAGTNGKGSTASMLASILTAAGYKTGLYTSPFIFEFNERMQINGKSISDDELAKLTEQVQPHALAMADRPREFELVTAIAALYFTKHDCDYVVFETGMGGELDATNFVQSPVCSVITAIGLDHVQELGDTLPKIARTKAGIIKPDCDTVLYEQTQDVMDVIADVCRDKNSSLTITEPNRIQSIGDSINGQTFTYKDSPEYTIRLLGAHQLRNAATVLEVIDLLRRRGAEISADAVYDGLLHTRWPARFEVVMTKPCFIIDGGHNPQCAETIRANVEKYFPNNKIIFLIGILQDKDITGLTDIINDAACEYVTIKPNSPRAMAETELAQFLSERYNKPAYPCAAVSQGVKKAIELAGEQGIICAAGSLYAVGDIQAAVDDYLAGR